MLQLDIGYLCIQQWIFKIIKTRIASYNCIVSPHLGNIYNVFFI